MKEKATVLVVEDELITAESIAELLTEEEYKIAGIARDAFGAFKICGEADELPQVIICDINIKGDMKGTALAKELKEMYGCEIIFITAYSDSKTLQSAFAADPAMYVMKPYSDTQLLVAVQLAFHKVFKKQHVQVNNKLTLTEREKEIAQLVANGFSSKQIAGKLSISVETVKTHRRRMLQKNNVSSFPHLIFLMNQDS